MGKTGRRLYTPLEAFSNTWRTFRAMPALKQGRRSGQMSGQFMERIMLAVTQVNGCALCSYAHTKMALEAGMSAEEIQAMLAGTESDAPAEELPAILFAQHYADQRGRPSLPSWQRVIEVYGEQGALAVLSAVQVIMMGNTWGIPAGSLAARINGRAERIDSRSSVPYEIGMILLFLPFLLAGLPTALIASLIHARRFPIAA